MNGIIFERLKLVAQQGIIADFYDLIQADVKLLDHFDELPFVETPLHTAVSAGHIPFAMEIMRLKPSFAKKPDPEGFCPIHLALQNRREPNPNGFNPAQIAQQNRRMVIRLVQVDGDLVRVKGKEGMTPLHYAAITGDHILLDEFLSVCPHSIEAVTSRNETALHIALKHNRVEAFKRLERWLRKKRSTNEKFWHSKILNRQDEDGNTVLHIAVLKNQPEAVKLLLKSGVDVNSKNLDRKTAGDILPEQTPEDNYEDNYENNYREISNMLRRAGASPASRPPTITYFSRYLYLFLEQSAIHFKRQKTVISEERRNVLLVIASLLITITYQGILCPPGGIWQEDYYPDGKHKSPYRYIEEIPVPPGDDGYLPIDNIAGTPVGFRIFFPFVVFLTLNSLTFVLSYMTILLLIPTTFIYVILRLALLSLFVCYFCSLAVLVPSIYWSNFSFSCVALFLSIAVLYFSITRKVWGRLSSLWKKN